MARIWLMLLAIVAAAVALLLIANDWRGIVALFELADPTGGFGVYFHLGGLLANLAVIFVAVCVLFAAALPGARAGLAAIVFVPSAIEAAAALPCFIGRPGALCGVGLVAVAVIAIPLVAAAAIGFVAASPRRVRAAAAAATLALAGLIATAEARLSPATPDQCKALAEVTARSTCLQHFANRRGDERLCRAIEFRTTRFTCLRELAVAKRQPQLCEEIRDALPIAAYEAPAAAYRDTCLQNMAYALHDRSRCGKIADPQLRAGCDSHLR